MKYVSALESPSFGIGALGLLFLRFDQAVNCLWVLRIAAPEPYVLSVVIPDVVFWDGVRGLSLLS